MTFPITKFKYIEFEQINDTRITKDRFYRNRARGTQHSYFKFALTTIPLRNDDYRELSAEVMGYEGSFEIFSINNPIPALSSVTSDVTYEQTIKGSKTIRIQTTKDYKVGDFIQFSGSTKAYIISGLTDSGGIKTIRLSCPLIKTILIGSSVIYGANVVFQMSLRNPNTVQIDTSNFGVLDVELIEQG